MTTDLSKPLKPSKLTKAQLNQIAHLTDPAKILACLAKLNWTIEESISYLVDIARSAEREATRLNTIKYLNQLILDTMDRAGMTVMASKKVMGPDGEYAVFTGHLVSSALQSQDDKQTTMDDLNPSKPTTEKSNGRNTNDTNTQKSGTTEGLEGQQTPEEIQDSQEVQEVQEVPTADGSPILTPDPEIPSAGATKPREPKDANDTELATTKAPTGRGVRSGHFPGIASGGRDKTGDSESLDDYFPGH